MALEIKQRTTQRSKVLGRRVADPGRVMTPETAGSAYGIIGNALSAFQGKLTEEDKAAEALKDSKALDQLYMDVLERPEAAAAASRSGDWSVFEINQRSQRPTIAANLPLVVARAQAGKMTNQLNTELGELGPSDDPQAYAMGWIKENTKGINNPTLEKELYTSVLKGVSGTVTAVSSANRKAFNNDRSTEFVTGLSGRVVSPDYNIDRLQEDLVTTAGSMHGPLAKNLEVLRESASARLLSMTQSGETQEERDMANRLVMAEHSDNPNGGAMWDSLTPEKRKAVMEAGTKAALGTVTLKETSLANAVQMSLLTAQSGAELRAGWAQFSNNTSLLPAHPVYQSAQTAYIKALGALKKDDEFTGWALNPTGPAPFSPPATQNKALVDLLGKPQMSPQEMQLSVMRLRELGTAVTPKVAGIISARVMSDDPKVSRSAMEMVTAATTYNPSTGRRKATLLGVLGEGPALARYVAIMNLGTEGEGLSDEDRIKLVNEKTAQVQSLPVVGSAGAYVKNMSPDMQDEVRDLGGPLNAVMADDGTRAAVADLLGKDINPEDLENGTRSLALTHHLQQRLNLGAWGSAAGGSPDVEKLGASLLSMLGDKTATTIVEPGGSTIVITDELARTEVDKKGNLVRVQPAGTSIDTFNKVIGDNDEGWSQGVPVKGQSVVKYNNNEVKLNRDETTILPEAMLKVIEQRWTLSPTPEDPNPEPGYYSVLDSGELSVGPMVSISADTPAGTRMPTSTDEGNGGVYWEHNDQGGISLKFTPALLEQHSDAKAWYADMFNALKGDTGAAVVSKDADAIWQMVNTKGGSPFTMENETLASAAAEHLMQGDSTTGYLKVNKQFEMSAAFQAGTLSEEHVSALPIEFQIEYKRRAAGAGPLTRDDVGPELIKVLTEGMGENPTPEVPADDPSQTNPDVSQSNDLKEAAQSEQVTAVENEVHMGEAHPEAVTHVRDGMSQTQAVTTAANENSYVPNPEQAALRNVTSIESSYPLTALKPDSVIPSVGNTRLSKRNNPFGAEVDGTPLEFDSPTQGIVMAAQLARSAWESGRRTVAQLLSDGDPQAAAPVGADYTVDPNMSPEARKELEAYLAGEELPSMYTVDPTGEGDKGLNEAWAKGGRWHGPRKADAGGLDNSQVTPIPEDGGPGYIPSEPTADTKRVARMMGVSQDMPLDLSDSKVMANFLKAQASMNVGSNDATAWGPYIDKVIVEGKEVSLPNSGTGDNVLGHGYRGDWPEAAQQLKAVGAKDGEVTATQAKLLAHMRVSSIIQELPAWFNGVGLKKHQVDALTRFLYDSPWSQDGTDSRPLFLTDTLVKAVKSQDEAAVARIIRRETRVFNQSANSVQKDRLRNSLKMSRSQLAIAYQGANVK